MLAVNGTADHNWAVPQQVAVMPTFINSRPNVVMTDLVQSKKVFERVPSNKLKNGMPVVM